MDSDVARMVEMWKKEISDQVETSRPYQLSQQLRQLAAFFAPGQFYFFVLNFHNLSIDYLYGNVESILGLKPEECTIPRFLQLLPPQELKAMEKKEAFAGDFLFRFLEPSQLPFYKVVYCVNVKDARGVERKILHQATTLTVSEIGKVEHVLGVHTDVTHLQMVDAGKVSFISLDGNRSYYNLNPEAGTFDPDQAGTRPLSGTLTARELEVIRHLAKGMNAEQIAEEMRISYNTIRTHRKNILQKTRCANTTEVVARCLVEGAL